MGLFDSWQKGVAAGKENRRDRIMGEFGQKALGGDKEALSQVYGVDTNAGMQLQQYGMQQQQAQRQAEMAQRQMGQEDAGRAALMFAQTGDPQYYAMWRGSLASLPNAPPLPEALSPDDIEPAKQSAQAFAQAYGGFKGAEVPSAIRELQMLQSNPELAKLDMQRRQAGFGRPQLIETDQGYAWATPEGASPLNYGQAQQGGELDPVQDFPQLLAGAPGAQVSSVYRDPKHNAQVGGVPNSYHMRGQAMDVANLPPQLRQQLAQQARSRGYDAIDEGDHLHIEPSRGSQARSSFGPGQRVMPAAKDKAPGALQEKLTLAQQMGATPEQLKQMVLGDSAGGGKQSATQIKLANTAKAKLVDLTAIDNQLAKVEQTFKPLQNSYSAGPLIGGLLPSEDGKRFDAAVSLLQGMVRKLTRTPGEGAMSDYETKLAQLANPSRSEYESVTADQIQQLRDLIKTTREGYEALLQDAGGNSANVPKPRAQQSGDFSHLWGDQ